jgi:hypothetical protein
MAENEFEKQCVVMGHFIENAKSYVQLSAGALVLTVTFLHEVVGIPKDQRVGVDWFLIASWVCFLVAALSGAFYQYLAVKFLEWKSGVGRHFYEWLERMAGTLNRVSGERVRRNVDLLLRRRNILPTGSN